MATSGQAEHPAALAQGVAFLRKLIPLLLVLVLAAAGCGLLKPLPKPLARTSPPGVSFEGVSVGEMSEAGVRNILASLAAERYVPQRDACFNNETGAIVPEKPGRLLDVAAGLADIMNAAPGASLAGVYRELPPGLTAAELGQGQVIGRYATKISDFHPSAPRVQNIRLAVHLINNAHIEPGGEFSFNNRVGEPTEERGFRPARIFGDNGQDTGIGGGICQVSTTLYNAVVAAGLTVTERHPHSQPVEYVPAGQDATTYTDKDLRFINSRRRNIIIRALQPADKVAVDFFELPK